MGGTESNEVAKDDARLQHPMVLRSPPVPAPKGKSKKEGAGPDTVVTTAKDGTKTAVTTSADGATVTTVVTKPDGSSTTTTETVTTTDSEVELTQQGKQVASPTAAAAASAVADFESVSEEKKRAQSLEEELAWYAWSGSAIAAAMGVKSSEQGTLRELSDHSGVLFASTVVTAQAGKNVSDIVTSSEVGGERKKEDFKRWLPAFLTYVTSHGRRFETLTAVELFIFARAFCRFHVLAYSVDQEKEKSHADRALVLAARRAKERKVAWELARAFTLYYPEFPIHRRGLRFSKTNRILMDQVPVENESSFQFIALHRRMSKWLRKFIVISLLRESSDDCTCAENTIVIHDGEIVYSGSWGEAIKYVQELGVECPSQKDVAMHLNKHGSQKATAALFDRREAATTSTVLFRLADEVVMLSKSPIVDMSDSETRLHLMNTGTFNKVQASSASNYDAFSDKPAPGAYMYDLHSNEATSDSDDNGDNSNFDAGDWLLSWFNPTTHGPRLTTKAAARKILSKWAANKSHNYTEPSQTTKTEVFRSEEADGSITIKTVRTTTRTETSAAGELVTTIEVETTTETETQGGSKSTTVEMETTTETATEVAAPTSAIVSTEGMTAVSSTEEAGAAPGETVKTEVFRSEEADGSITIKTVRTTTRTETSAAGELVTTIEVETTTETETQGGSKSTTVEMETTTETATEVAAPTSAIVSTEGMTAVSSTEEAGAAPGETVKTEVFRSEEADGSITIKTVRTTTRTETSAAGELVTTIEVETTTETE
ncbi:hypothetical protein JM16_008600, partial [Phytophthora kernoviae]